MKNRLLELFDVFLDKRNAENLKNLMEEAVISYQEEHFDCSRNAPIKMADLVTSVTFTEDFQRRLIGFLAEKFCSRAFTERTIKELDCFVAKKIYKYLDPELLDNVIPICGDIIQSAMRESKKRRIENSKLVSTLVSPEKEEGSILEREQTDKQASDRVDESSLFSNFDNSAQETMAQESQESSELVCQVEGQNQKNLATSLSELNESSQEQPTIGLQMEEGTMSARTFFAQLWAINTVQIGTEDKPLKIFYDKVAIVRALTENYLKYLAGSPQNHTDSKQKTIASLFKKIDSLKPDQECFVTQMVIIKATLSRCRESDISLHRKEFWQFKTLTNKLLKGRELKKEAELLDNIFIAINDLTDYYENLEQTAPSVNWLV
ncbi:MAG: hypothetical protein H2069_06480 [Legionella sp.]|nr:hypothetical protein [Legionella sp.]